MMLLLPSLSLLLCLLLLCSAPVSAQTWALYSFCYSISNTLSSSPYLPFAILAVGTLNVSTDSSGSVWNSSQTGSRVYGAVGSRSIAAQGQQPVNHSIIGIAAVNSYQWNDNELHLSPPYLSSYHSLTFILDGVASFVTGPAVSALYPNGSAFVNLNNNTLPRAAGDGVAESDNPLNDGLTVSIVSLFNLSLARDGFSPDYADCPYQLPELSISADAVSAYEARLQFAFCYSISSAYLSGIDGNWSIAVSGLLTTTAWGSSNRTGEPVLLITAVSGTRVFSLIDVAESLSRTSRFGLGGVNAAQAQYGNATYQHEWAELASSSYYANNLLYPTNFQLPYVDALGVMLVSSSDVETEETVASTPVFRLFTVDGLGAEEVLDLPQGYRYDNYPASLLLEPVDSLTASGLSLAAWSQQCSPSYGTASVYSFCYFIDDSARTGHAKGVVTVSGTLTASSAPRDGRAALLLQSMTGVRTVTRLSTSPPTVISQSIIALAEPDLTADGLAIDNVIWTSPPYLDVAGVLFTLSEPAAFPSGTSASADVNLFLYDPFASVFSYGEVSGNGDAVTSNSSRFELFIAEYDASHPLTACQHNDTEVTAPPTLVTYSLCGHQLDSLTGYLLSVTAVVTVYNVHVNNSQGRPGFAIQSITGSRLYADVNGLSSVTPITGLADSAQLSENDVISVPPSQLIFTSAPFVDAAGVLYAVDGAAASYSATGSAASAVGLYWASTTSVYVDMTLQVQLDPDDSDTVDYTAAFLRNISMALVADDGISAAKGTILQTTGSNGCSAAATQQFAFCYSIQNTLTSSPYGPWSVFVTGVLTVRMTATTGEFAGVSSGYQVLSISGTRTLHWQGAVTAADISGIAAVNGYNFNDNIIFLASPYLDPVIHSLSYQLNTSQYINVEAFLSPQPAGVTGISEFDLPMNDGVTNVISSRFHLALLAANNSNQCPLSAPVIDYNETVVAQLSQSRLWAFCWSYTGIDGAADSGAPVYSISSSGTLTTTAYAGNTTTNQTVYLVTAINGTRVMAYGNGSVISSVSLVSIGNINAALSSSLDAAFPLGSAGSGMQGNNVLYASFPFVDDFGIVVVAQSELSEAVYGAASTNVLRVFNAALVNDLQEWLLDFHTGYVYEQHDGNIVVLPYDAAVASIGSQCSFTAGPSAVVFSFCYHLTTASNTTYAYGLMTAVGPVQRQGRQAYTLQSMTGIRSVINGSISQHENIVASDWVNEEITLGSINSNLLYLSSPALDQLGLAYRLLTADGLNTDINLWMDANYSLFEWTSSTSDTQQAPVSNSSFLFSFYAAGSPLQTCDSSIVPAAPQFATYSFCYSLTSASIFVTTSGLMTVYTTPISIQGRTGYAIANMTGSRQWYTADGQSGVDAIVGMSSDYVSGNAGWVVSQSLYLSAPHLDSFGIVFVTGEETVVRLVSDSTGRLTETLLSIPSVSISSDSGDGSSSVMLLGNEAACANISVQFSSSSSSSSGADNGGGNGGGDAGGDEFSSSSGGLSRGAIAGVVIGTVLGTVLLCIVLLFALRYVRRERQEASKARVRDEDLSIAGGGTGTGRSAVAPYYEQHRDESPSHSVRAADYSNVELQQAAGEAAEGEGEHSTVA